MLPKYSKRLLHKTIKNSDGCWLWQGALDFGYGRMRVGKGKREFVHRLSWQHFNGEIPEELKVLHRCDVRNCINPEHLFLGTQLDNMQDKVNKGRYINHNMLKTHCVNGHTLSKPNKNGHRKCYECARKRSLAWARKNRTKKTD